MHIRFGMWLHQFFVNEPLNALDKVFGIKIGDAEDGLKTDLNIPDAISEMEFLKEIKKFTHQFN